MIRRKVITLNPTGADGSAAATALLTLSRPAVVRFIDVDYTSQANTTDLVIKADSSTGNTIFTNTNGNTDITARPVGMPGIDEGGAATAATDGLSGGWPVYNGIYVSIAQANASTVTNGAGNKSIVVKLWIEQ